MSTRLEPPRRRPAALFAGRVLPALLALVLLAGLVQAGRTVRAEEATFRQATAPLVGPTSTICPVAGSARQRPGLTLVNAVVSRQAPGRPGRLTGTPLGARRPSLSIGRQGWGARLTEPGAPVVLRGEGVMATASSGAVVGRAAEGPDSGLTAAPCTAAATSHWFPGIGAGRDQDTELVLTNPDDAQAEVSLRYYGSQGLVAVPGSPGVTIPARGTRTVPVTPASAPDGPLTVEVRASAGRVAAAAREVVSDGLEPAGADWHPGSVAPGRRVVVGAVPGGPGTRRLVVANPGAQRAEVAVSVLGVQGAFAPAGADAVVVEPESTATVELAPGLAGEAAAVQLTSDQPVTAVVLATSRRPPAQPDLAVSAALPALVRTGVSAVARIPGAEAELVLSNGSDVDAPGSFELLSLSGVGLRSEEILVAARSTATRRLEVDGPAYLVVRVPDGAAVTGGITFSQPEGTVAGLTTLGVLSPDVASRASRPVPDPRVGR